MLLCSLVFWFWFFFSSVTLGLIVVEGRVVFLVAWLFSLFGNSSAYSLCAKNCIKWKKADYPEAREVMLLASACRLSNFVQAATNRPLV